MRCRCGNATSHVRRAPANENADYPSHIDPGCRRNPWSCGAADLDSLVRHTQSELCDELQAGSRSCFLRGSLYASNSCVGAPFASDFFSTIAERERRNDLSAWRCD